MDESISDYDYDFTPTNSNLANLFGAALTPESSNLTYRAPKQPKSATPQQNDSKKAETKTESSVLHALVVAVWKLCDNKYTAVGKLGLAVLGSEIQNAYELILYKEKRNVIMRARLGSGFELTLSKDDFASFHDNAKQNWLVKFTDSKELDGICDIVRKYGGNVVFSPDYKKCEDKKNEEKVEAATKSSEEEISENRAEILSRMARLGQSILPGQSSKVEDFEEIVPKPSYEISPSNERPHSVIQTITPSQSHSTLIQSQFQNMPVAVNQPYDPLNLFFVENRTHNSEVRMNLSQISDKLNQVLKLVEPPKVEGKPSENETVLRRRIKVFELKIENLNREIENGEEKFQKLQQELCKQTEVLKITEERVKKLEMELDNSKIVLPNVGSEEEGQKAETFAAMLKESMNALYERISGSFDNDTMYSRGEIDAVVARSIKLATKKIIQNFQETYSTKMCDITK